MNPNLQGLAGVIWLTAITLIFWAVFDSVVALSIFSVGLLGMIAYHHYNLSRLDKWLRSNNISYLNAPDGPGAWGLVFARVARLLRRHQNEVRRLEHALDRLHRATSAMPEGVVILGDADQLEWCNLAAEGHLGLNLKLDGGQHITRIVRQIQFVDYLNFGDFSKPIVLKQSQKSDIFLSLQLVPYGDSEKLLISRDITRFEKIEIMRRDFIANVSHELRTPLTVIGGFLETLLDSGKLEKMEQNVLELMARQATRMHRLIEDLLTLSRLENSQNSPKEERIDIVKLMRGIYQEAQSLSSGRHQIRLNVAREAVILGNEDELRSAFSNLVSNAVRYTPQDGNISLHWIQEGEEGVFFVQDSGIGIEPSYIPRLTERFYRVDRGRSRETGGTGLGLAIVKHILTHHRASLEIVSKPGHGSIFKIRFPASRVLWDGCQKT
ncbi:phosphate regulon sensor histidine kinase PhoR [Nitrosomonas mobilis]|uniref:phosphate regulon sensor histidine kinase PhoR n=1 Tax=Nitrosomonas mobilis TaxID=51642 RepID=UPI000B7F36DB|nr:phosphate regulon sensor histidine kinase PhoR [Nitrosomonas mobilis]HNO74711.1 phosphate regulon sensor histidine kinase PhoR [Nitrosomonas mobilis]